jgi:hypothetical protein
MGALSLLNAPVRQMRMPCTTKVARSILCLTAFEELNLIAMAAAFSGTTREPGPSSVTQLALAAPR